MKHRRGITSLSSSQSLSQGTRNISRKIYGLFCLGVPAIIILSTGYIIKTTIESFTDDLFPVNQVFFSNISNGGPISSQGVFEPQSTHDCEKFDHGDVLPTFPNLTSVFNCGSSSGRCQWFYPAKFLNRYCGIGKKYSDSIDYMERLRVEHVLWKGGPPIVLPWVSLHPGIKPNGKPPGRTTPLPTHNLSFIHVHKTGGTSLVLAFSNLSSYRKTRGKRMISYQPLSNRASRFRGRLRKQKSNSKSRRRRIQKKVESVQKTLTSSDTRQRKETSAFLNGAVKYRKHWGEREHTLFAVVRDPAERFISAIGQATGAYGSANNGVAAWLRNECVKNTGRETLRCFVDIMMKNETWIEVHFTPMLYEISFATLYKDIPVAVFPFKEVPTLMYELNQQPTERKKDGRKKGYRKSEILTQLRLKDYDEGTLRDLCKVYEMDVLFMQHIGYKTNCDSYLSF